MESDEADQKDMAVLAVLAVLAVREASRPDGRGPGANDQQRGSHGSFLHAEYELAGLAGLTQAISQ